MLTNPSFVYLTPPPQCAGEYQRGRPILISKGEESKAGHIWKPQSAFEYHHRHQALCFCRTSSLSAFCHHYHFHSLIKALKPNAIEV